MPATTSVIEFVSSAWSTYTDWDVSKLEQVQKNAARFLTNSVNYDPYCSSSDIVSSLNWTTLKSNSSFRDKLTEMFYKSATT